MTGDKLSTYTPPMIPSPGDGAGKEEKRVCKDRGLEIDGDAK